MLAKRFLMYEQRNDACTDKAIPPAGTRSRGEGSSEAASKEFVRSDWLTWQHAMDERWEHA